MTVQSWIGRFGDDALAERPWLATLGAWEEIASGDLAATEHLADITERASFSGRPPDGTASFESGRAMLRVATCRAGADDMRANASLAVALELPGSRWRDFALWMLAFAHLVNGDQAAADDAMAEAIASARAARNDGLAYAIVGHRALLAMDRGDWAAAAVYATQGEIGTGAPQVEGYLSSALRVHRSRPLRPPWRGPRHGATGDAAGRQSAAAADRGGAGGGCPGPPGPRAGPPRGRGRAGGSGRPRTGGPCDPSRPDLGVLPAEVAAMQAEVARLPIGVAGASSLTTAELRVLSMLPYYLSFREIGQRLGVRESTVKTHAASVYGKLGASTRGEAVDLAVEAGLLDPSPHPGATCLHRVGGGGPSRSMMHSASTSVPRQA